MAVVSLIDSPTTMHDSFGRHLHYLRVSLTDACNLRCVYCMPEDIVFRPPATLLQDDEILTLVRVGASLGVDKIRLTGGEPTVRRNVVELAREIKAIPGIQKLTMTTNGVKLAELARPLAEAGLDSINISVDSLDPAKFRHITRRGDLSDMWRGIAASVAAGLTPIKLNCVVTRGFNDADVVDLARLTINNAWEIRFIELMPFGGTSDFQESQVVSSAETTRGSRRAWVRWLRSRATTATIRRDPTGCRAPRDHRLHQQRHRTVLRGVHAAAADRRWEAASLSSPR